MSKQWFDVDKIGLGKQAEEYSKGRLVGELVQNGLDEPGVTQIAVSLVLVPGRPLADLTVEDDITEEVDGLLIHEFGHEYSGDHLSEDYHEALCRLAAKLKRLALDKPDEFRRFCRRH